MKNRDTYEIVKHGKCWRVKHNKMQSGDDFPTRDAAREHLRELKATNRANMQSTAMHAQPA
jgi:hypothetical protein